jgi:hypothetical protein
VLDLLRLRDDGFFAFEMKQITPRRLMHDGQLLHLRICCGLISKKAARSPLTDIAAISAGVLRYPGWREHRGVAPGGITVLS